MQVWRMVGSRDPYHLPGDPDARRLHLCCTSIDTIVVASHLTSFSLGAAVSSLLVVTALRRVSVVTRPRQSRRGLERQHHVPAVSSLRVRPPPSLRVRLGDRADILSCPDRGLVDEEGARASARFLPPKMWFGLSPANASAGANVSVRRDGRERPRRHEGNAAHV